MAKVAINKSLLKEYKGSNDERVVYMEDGDEFQIQFFNPESTVISISISLNGKSFPTQLILRPGERVWLERFIDSEQKFKFSTYEVGTSKEIKKAIENNGVIELKFYKEKPAQLNTPIFINPHITYSYPKVVSDGYGYSTCYYSADATSASNDVASAVMTVTTGDAANCNLSLDSCGASYSASYSASTYDASELRGMSAKKSSKSVETGRIEKGNHSNQKIDYVSGYDFNYFPFAEEKIHIYPKSTKPVFKSDLTKKYCSNCGRKISPKHKFCPYCGEKIN